MGQCELCNKNEANLNLMLDEKDTLICYHCYNELKADEFGVDLEDLVETFSFKDFQGTSRTFNVERHVDTLGIFMKATEDIDYGYEFSVSGELDDDQQDLLHTLIEKTRKGIRKQQVGKAVLSNGYEEHYIMDDLLTGRIECVQNPDDVPIVIMDGRPFTWEEVGKMLTDFEGSYIKLELFDTDDFE